jgi:putative ABC transport system permease protein
MSNLVRDLRFAARALARQPGLTLAAVLTLALGIGGNTAIFSIVDSVLLTPPPFREPGKLVVVWASNPGLAKAAKVVDELGTSPGDFYDLRRENRSFQVMAMIAPDRMRMTGLGAPEEVAAVRVSGDFSEVMGTIPLLGRGLQAADDPVGQPAVALLSYNWWRRRFSGDPHVLGSKIVLNGMPLTVVGVMPPRFAFPRGAEMPAGYGYANDPDAWVPMALPDAMRADRATRFFVGLGRLRPGIGTKAAASELNAICAQLARRFPDLDKGWGARLVPITEQMVSDLRPTLLVLWGAVGLLLLIACANVANLLLARAAAREKEIALRIAIGASRSQLMRQLLAESAVLALVGGALGTALAAAGLRFFAAYVPPHLAGAASFALSASALAFTLVLCLAATLLAGLAPALQLTRPDLASSLREGTRAGAGTVKSRRTVGALVVSEVAFAVLLLIGAGLLLRSYVRLLGVDPGFQTARVLTFEVNLPFDTPPARIVAFFERAVDRLRPLPGVAAAAAVSELPLTGVESVMGVLPEGQPAPVDVAHAREADYHMITAGYFAAMSIPLLRGRLLDAGDGAGRPAVAVIDWKMARSCWPGQDPLGKRFRLGSLQPRKDSSWITVVGVVGTIRHTGLHADPRPQMYRLLPQTPDALMPYQMVIVLRTLGKPEALVAAARSAILQVDPSQPIANARTLERVVADSVAPRRLNLLLLGLFAGLALVLAGVGIYGITAYSVAQRTRELGLRMALGAPPEGVLRLVLKEAGTKAGLGIAIGLAAAFGLTRLLGSLLYGVSAADPLTYLAVSAALALVVLLAAFLPGRRATRVSPSVALRME